jgi:hypothetical protein
MAQAGKGYVAYGDFDYESIMIYPTPDRMSPSFRDFKAIEAIYNISIIVIGPKKLIAALGQLQSTAALAAAGSRAAAATDKLRSIGSIAHKG